MTRQDRAGGRGDGRRCFTCRQFMKLSPGRAGICHVQQEGREWNQGMAVVSDDGYCEKYAPHPGDVQ